MKTIDLPLTRPAWAKAIIPVAKEFPLTPLSIINGKIPSGLRGTLYRNGPARLELGGKRVGHWFDGDGAILAVNFTDAGANSVYRYVKTSGYLAESKAGKFLYSNYGMTASGLFWNRWLKPVKNAANTSVLALSDKLLALWEGGKPHALDLETLETRGMDDLGGLSNKLPYSAHPKRDTQTGEIFNFGVTPGAKSKLNVYKSDSTGKILRKASVTIDGLPLIHDFVIAGQYLVFFIPPVRVNLLSVMFGSSYSDAMEWKPQLGTQVLVFDRENLSLVSRGEAEPWYQWHFVNGCTDDRGRIVVDLIWYSDFQTNRRLEEVATGKINTVSEGKLRSVNLEPKTAKINATEELLDRFCEFPVVSPSQVGKSWRFTYLTLHRKAADISQEVYGAIARFDRQTGNLAEADLGENRYPSEAIYAPDANHADKGWVLSVVYDGNTDTSEVWVFDRDRLDELPVCRLGLPEVIPLSFHGTWKPV